jgi:hypothetical protein
MWHIQTSANPLHYRRMSDSPKIKTLVNELYFGNSEKLVFKNYRDTGSNHLLSSSSFLSLLLSGFVKLAFEAVLVGITVEEAFVLRLDSICIASGSMGSLFSVSDNIYARKTENMTSLPQSLSLFETK